MRLELSPYIERIVKEIGDWIAQDNPTRAVSFIQEIREELRWIGEDARLAMVGRYLILFRVAGEVVRIERMVFGGHDLPGLM